MAEISIQIRGIEAAYRKLGTDILGAIEPAFAGGVIRVEGRMKKYPPPRPGQTYRRGIDPRSERLGQRWTHQVTRTATEVRAKTGNNASYAPWVQNDEFQAWMHRRRWTTDVEALEAEAPSVEREAGRLVEEAMKE